MGYDATRHRKATGYELVSRAFRGRTTLIMSVKVGIGSKKMSLKDQ